MNYYDFLNWDWYNLPAETYAPVSNKHVFVADRWHQRKATELAEEIHAKNKKFQHFPVDYLKEVLTDCFTMFFECRPRVNPMCKDRVRRHVFNRLMNDAAVKSLRSKSVYRYAIAEFASLQTLREVIQLIEVAQRELDIRQEQKRKQQEKEEKDREWEEPLEQLMKNLGVDRGGDDKTSKPSDTPRSDSKDDADDGAGLEDILEPDPGSKESPEPDETSGSSKTTKKKTRPEGGKGSSSDGPPTAESERFGADAGIGDRASERSGDLMGSIDGVDETDEILRELDLPDAAMEEFREKVQDACDSVIALENMCHLFHGSDSMGLSSFNDPTNTLNSEMIQSMAETFAKNPQIKEILQLAGQFKEVMKKNKKRSTRDEYGWAQQVECTDRLENVLPGELAGLFHPDLRMEMLSRLVEGRLVGIGHENQKPAGKGPIIVTVDESGSMAGEKVTVAKAVASAMIYEACRQQRWLGLVSFSGGVEPQIFDFKLGVGEKLSLSHLRRNYQDWMSWLKSFIGGGTNLDVPLNHLDEIYKKLNPPKGRTDVIMLTDAEIDPSLVNVAAYETWRKKTGARVFAVVFNRNSQRTVSNLQRFCDHVVIVNYAGCGLKKHIDITKIQNLVT